MITPNIIIGKGTANQLTVDTEEIEQEYQRMNLSLVTTPGATTKILDLLRVEMRYIVTGVISADDESKILNLFNTKGVFTFEYDGQDYAGLFEKLNITNSSKVESPFLVVKFTLVRGNNLGSV